MNPRSLVNIGLLIAVAVACTALYLKPQRGSEQTYALIPFPLEELREVEIQRAANVPIVLVRAQGQWRMTSPVVGRLDEIMLGRVLDIAGLQPSTRMPAAELARFELDKPWARVRFNQHTVEFGMSNAMTQELYLRSGDHVHLVSARVAASVPSNVASLLAHRLFAADEIPVAFRLSHFSLRHDGIRWRLDPHDARLSQDDLVRWVDQWRLASSIVTQPRASDGVREKISVELRDARVLSLSVVSLSPDLVVSREDEGLEYHFPARLGALLLASPDAGDLK